MRSNIAHKFGALTLLLFISATAFGAKPSVELRLLGSRTTGLFDKGAAEIVAHDPVTQRLFVVNAFDSETVNPGIDVLDASDPSNPTFLFSIDLSPYGRAANSVDVKNGIVAAAVEANVKTDNGKVVFFDTSGNYLNDVPAGALPDMLTFTPNGDRILVANEGEPSGYGAGFVDPIGSITIVDMRDGVANAAAQNVDFTQFNGTAIDPRIRIYGPGSSISQDLEPEYIAVDHNSKTAYITLQENNALAVLDIKSATITKLVSLGFKDYSSGENKLDASDSSAGSPRIDIRNWPVFGMYQPDSISTLKYKNRTFLVTANEGDAREYSGLVEEVRLGSSSYMLDPIIFPSAVTLKLPGNLGRLNVTNKTGDIDGDGDFDEIYTLGGRSFSIWTEDGELVYDSGDHIEQETAARYPLFFNASNTDNSLDSRSDNKGPEPEAVTIGKAYGRTYAFVGLERIGGIMVYDVSDPYDVKYIQYINNRNFGVSPGPGTVNGTVGDLGPEGIKFISGDDSPTGVPLIAVANEISGTTTLYQFVKVR
ncbi:MAG: choice-of-anchor I family protein [Pyrinomonadaceae bacterium]|nr:choice-of-anchor I family protein [Pyrinomonadaceae bacterium]MBP6213849.1 choice-of-anchor I family protein [Pyrinomonadaceae bacterium]